MAARNPDNPARRCLWSTTSDDEAKNDNFWNKQKEDSCKELEEQCKRFHYDFINDKPLTGEVIIRNDLHTAEIQPSEKPSSHNEGSSTINKQRTNEASGEIEVPNRTTNKEVDESDTSIRIENEDEVTENVEEKMVPNSTPPKKKNKVV